MGIICLAIQVEADPVKIFHKHGGQLRMSEAIESGFTRYMLYKLRDDEVIEQISRGVYRLADLPPISNPDLVTVALRCPNSVVCLISALSFHEMTTQIPHKISIAIPRDSHPPSLKYPPLDIHRMINHAYQAGIEKHQIDGIPVNVYNPEKTLVDCFKFRNKVGKDVVLEALKLYKARKKFNHRKILEYAKICRVDKIVLPYLEAII